MLIKSFKRIFFSGIFSVFDFFRAKINSVSFARSIGVKVGDDCRFLGISRRTFGSEPYLIRIGNHVTITRGVEFITHDGGVWVFRGEDPDIDVFGSIEVGDNVFLGMRALILPGVRIGNNCVIGAGSIVTKDIPSNSVACGVPARVIGSLEDYKLRVATKNLGTKRLNQYEKERFLVRYFWRNGGVEK